MVSNSRKKALNKSTLFLLDRKYVSTSRNEGFIEKYVFTRCKSYFRCKITSQKSSLFWLERFCINNMSLQNTATVASSMTRSFLKDISSGRKICFNKDFFIKITLPLGSTFRKKWKTKIIVLSKLIIHSYYEELEITWLF